LPYNKHLIHCNLSVHWSVTANCKGCWADHRSNQICSSHDFGNTLEHVKFNLCGLTITQPQFREVLKTDIGLLSHISLNFPFLASAISTFDFPSPQIEVFPLNFLSRAHWASCVVSTTSCQPTFGFPTTFCWRRSMSYSQSRFFRPSSFAHPSSANSSCADLPR